MNKKITYDFRNDRIQKELKNLPKDALLFDTETNGLNLGNENKKDNLEIIELALVNLKGETVYHSLFKPELPISGTLSIVNNITNEMLEDAPKWKNEWEKIKNLMKGKTIIGFNIDNFDINALDVTCRRYDISFKEECPFETIDMMPMFIKFTNLFKLTYSNSMFIKQEVAREICGLKTKQTHRADDDCRDLLGLINEMKRRLAEKDPIDAEMFISKLQKDSLKSRYKSLLEREAKAQKMFDDLISNKPLKNIIERYKTMDEEAKLENIIVKMNKNGFVDVQEQLDLDDDTLVDVIEKYEETGDIYQTSKELGVDEIKVKNAVFYQMPKLEATKQKPSKAEIIENLSNDELKLLEDYISMKTKYSKIDANLKSISKKVREAIEQDLNINQNTLVLANSAICFDYSKQNENKTFDKETFKMENPTTYEQYLVKKDGVVQLTSPRTTLNFTFKNDMLPDDLMFENVSDFTKYVAENMKEKNKLDREMKKMKTDIVALFTEKNCNRIDFKQGSFNISFSDPSPKFDTNRFDAELPQLKEKYTKHKIETNLKMKTARGVKEAVNLDEWLENHNLLNNQTVQTEMIVEN